MDASLVECIKYVGVICIGQAQPKFEPFKMLATWGPLLAFLCPLLQVLQGLLQWGFVQLASRLLKQADRLQFQDTSAVSAYMVALLSGATRSPGLLYTGGFADQTVQQVLACHGSSSKTQHSRKQQRASAGCTEIASQVHLQGMSVVAHGQAQRDNVLHHSGVWDASSPAKLTHGLQSPVQHGRTHIPGYQRPEGLRGWHRVTCRPAQPFRLVEAAQRSQPARQCSARCPGETPGSTSDIAGAVGRCSASVPPLPVAQTCDPPSHKRRADCL